MYPKNILLQIICIQSKQEADFLVYSSNVLLQKMFVQSKQAGRCFFSLFIINQTPNVLLSKNVYSRQVEGHFLVSSPLINIVHTIFHYKKRMGDCFLVYSSLISIVRILQNFCNSMLFKLLFFSLFSKLCKTSIHGCFLLCLSNFVKLLWTFVFK